MKKYLKGLFLILAVVCIPAGFFTHHEHPVSLWHTIPSVGALFGALGALILMLAVKIVGSFTFRKEDFYD